MGSGGLRRRLANNGRAAHRSTGKRIPRLPSETKIYIQGSTSDLYHRVAADSNLSVHRLRITTLDGALVPNDKQTTVDSVGLKDGSTIQVKDLGMMLSLHRCNE